MICYLWETFFLLRQIPFIMSYDFCDLLFPSYAGNTIPVSITILKVKTLTQGSVKD